MTEEKTPEELWAETKEVLLESAKETVGYTSKQKSKTWISDVTFDKIQERNNAKTKNAQNCKESKHTAQGMLRKDKQKQLDNMWEELQTTSAKGNMRKLFHQVRFLTST